MSEIPYVYLDERTLAEQVSFERERYEWARRVIYEVRCAEESSDFRNMLRFENAKRIWALSR